jgi:hypothetical protein
VLLIWWKEFGNELTLKGIHTATTKINFFPVFFLRPTILVFAHIRYQH